MANSLLVHTAENGDFDSTAASRRWYRRIFSATFGTATFYLKKPLLPPISEYRNLLIRRNPRAEENENGSPRRGVQEYARQREEASLAEQEQRGSEVKLIRRVRIWEKGNLKPCPIDFGVGMRVALDPVVKIEPVARVRVADMVTVKVLPDPVIKLSKRLPFHFQGMQAHFRYEVPIRELPHSWWKPPARMLIRFEHGSNSGFHFYPGGLEFGDHTIPLSSESKAALRVAAGLTFPREYPIRPQHGTMWEVYRLGIKTVW